MEGERRTPLVIRLIRLYGIAAYMDLLWITRDFKQAVLYVVSESLLSVAGVSTTLLLATRFNGIGPWSLDRILFMLAYSTAVQGAMELFFNFNVLEISRRIGRGQLDHVLIQPRPLWVSLITEGFVPFSGSASFLVGIGLLGWAANRLQIPITPVWIASLVGSLFASCAVVLAFSYIWGSLAFWSPHGAEEVCSGTNWLIYSLRAYPLDGLGPHFMAAMMSVAPVAFVAWMPSRALLGITKAPLSMAVTPIAAVLISSAAVAIFRKGLREYGRTGSQRYLSLGHRS